ncbi:MAG TPA: STAS domain-containing protein [Terriglobia bacterium]|nr:STAS domain-containing protein [Terriglobia bacterium]
MSTQPPTSAPSVLQLKTSPLEGAILVKCSGHLTFDVSADFKTQLRALIPNAKKIVLDLTDLAYMDSAGLGAVVSVYVSAKKSGCELQLINLSKRVRELLGITHLLTTFAACSEYNIKMP